jgi:hypothetical protein
LYLKREELDGRPGFVGRSMISAEFDRESDRVELSQRVRRPPSEPGKPDSAAETRLCVQGEFVVEQSNPVESERALVAAIVALFCGPQLHPGPLETAEDLNREFGHADLKMDGLRDVLAGKADLRVDSVAGLRSCPS